MGHFLTGKVCGGTDWEEHGPTWQLLLAGWLAGLLIVCVCVAGGRVRVAAGGRVRVCRSGRQAGGRVKVKVVRGWFRWSQSGPAGEGEGGAGGVLRECRVDGDGGVMMKVMLVLVECCCE